MAWGAIGGAVASTVVSSTLSGGGESSSSSGTTSQDQAIKGTTSTTGTELLSGSNLDPQSMQALQNLLGMLGTKVSAPTSPEFSKSAAISDTQGLIEAIFKEYENKLPSIFAAENASGLTRSTDTQKVVNQAFSDAVSKSAGLALDTITKYAGLGQNQQQIDLKGLLEAFGIAKGATTSATKTTDSLETVDKTSTSVGTSSEDKSGLKGGISVKGSDLVDAIGGFMNSSGGA